MKVGSEDYEQFIRHHNDHPCFQHVPALEAAISPLLRIGIQPNRAIADWTDWGWLRLCGNGFGRIVLGISLHAQLTPEGFDSEFGRSPEKSEQRIFDLLQR